MAVVPFSLAGPGRHAVSSIVTENTEQFELSLNLIPPWVWVFVPQ